jgi:small-conductance mechanosensitive channel
MAFATLWLGVLANAAVPDEKAAATPPPEDAVGEWSIQTTQRLSEIRERLSGPSDIEKWEKQLAVLEARFDTNLGDVASHPDAAHLLTDAAIRDATSELDAVSSRAAAINEVLNLGSAAMETLSREMRDIITHAQSLQTPTTAPLPEAIRARLDGIVGEATRLLTVAQQRLDRAAQLQNKILALQDRARTARGDLTEVDAERLRALIHVQQPPLWRVTGEEVVGSGAGSTRFIGQTLPAAVGFARDNIASVVLHVALFVGGYAFVSYLRRRFGSGARGGTTSRAATRPISAALLLMLLAAPVVYPDAPSGVMQIFGLLAIVPMLRILLLYLDPALRPAVYALTATFLFERITTAFARDIVLQRFCLLALSVVAVALFAWLHSLTLDTRLGLGRYLSPFVRRLIVAAIALSALSLVFNVLGNVDLALLLQTSTVRGAVLAAAQYAAVLVVDEIAHLVVHSLKARGVRSVAAFEQTILRRTRRLAVTAAVALWLAYMLSSMRMLAPLSDTIGAVLAARWTIGALTISMGRTVGFAVAVWVAIHASRITRVLLRDDVLPRFALPRGVPNAISTVANYAMVLIGVLVGAGILGIELSNVTLIVGALGVGIGFGLQNVVNNLVSGFILIFERSVQIGDTIQLSDLTGTVVHIGLRASQLRTGSGSEVIVPNGELISNRLINWTLSDRRRRLETTIGVAYGSDLDQVHAILHGVLAAESEVLRDPEPLVIFESFGDSALNFRLLFWIQDLDIGLRVTDRLNTVISKSLAAADIEIPFPQRDINIRTAPT